MPSPLFVVAQPLIFIAAALAFLGVTIIKLVLARDWSTLTSVPKFKDAWFGTMWNTVGGKVREAHGANVIPLLQGKVRAGIKTEAPKHPGVHGVVLEIGPGTGNWVSCFSDNTLGGGKVDKVYGVEPNPDLHLGLSKTVKAAGMQGKYEIVPLGIQDLGKAGIPKGSVDSIATLLCLCCIPEPEKNIRELYEYLKPGGQWYVYEHVKSHGVMRFYQCEWVWEGAADSQGRSTSSGRT